MAELDLKDWRTLEAYSDFRLVCLGKTFHLHQVILATNCPYFTSALSEKWSRSKDDTFDLTPPDFPFVVESKVDGYILVGAPSLEESRERVLSTLEIVLDTVYGKKVEIDQDDLDSIIYYIVWCDYLSCPSSFIRPSLRILAKHFSIVCSVANFPVGGWKTSLFQCCVDEIGPLRSTPAFPEIFWERMPLDLTLYFLESSCLYCPDDKDSGLLLIFLVKIWLAKGTKEDAEKIIDGFRRFIHTDTLREDEVYHLIEASKGLEIEPFTEEDLESMMMLRLRCRKKIATDGCLSGLSYLRCYRIPKETILKTSSCTPPSHFAGCIFGVIYNRNEHDDRLCLYLNVMRCEDAVRGSCGSCGYGPWLTKTKVKVSYTLTLMNHYCYYKRFFPYHIFLYTTSGKTSWGIPGITPMDKLPEEISVSLEVSALVYTDE
jgi:hypothetical protein